MAKAHDRIIVTNDMIGGLAMRAEIVAAYQELKNQDIHAADKRPVLIMAEGRGLMADFALPQAAEAERLEAWIAHLHARRRNPEFAKRLVEASTMRIRHDDIVVSAGIRTTAHGAQLYAEKLRPETRTFVCPRDQLADVLSAKGATVIRWDEAQGRPYITGQALQQDVGPTIAVISGADKRPLTRQLKRLKTPHVQVTTGLDTILLAEHKPAPVASAAVKAAPAAQPAPAPAEPAPAPKPRTKPSRRAPLRLAQAPL
jgi:hypothetical protein